MPCFFQGPETSDSRDAAPGPPRCWCAILPCESTMHLIPEARDQTSQAVWLSSLAREMSELIVNLAKNPFLKSQ